MKKNKGMIALVMGVVLMSGCAKTMYVKNGISQAQLNQDNADCQYDVVKNTPTYDGVGDPIASAISRNERKGAILDACYKSKGYHLQTKQESQGLTERQQAIADRYKQATAQMVKKVEPIGEYIVNICRPKDGKSYIECLNEKQIEMVSVSIFPDITTKMFREQEEFKQQLLRKEITRNEFKEYAKKSEDPFFKQMDERINNDVKNGVYTGKQ